MTDLYDLNNIEVQLFSFPTYDCMTVSWNTKGLNGRMYTFHEGQRESTATG